MAFKLVGDRKYLPERNMRLLNVALEHSFPSKEDAELYLFLSPKWMQKVLHVEDDRQAKLKI